MGFKISVALVSLVLAPSVSAEVREYQSSKLSPLVIELFTSQGCSSCPPADNWLADLDTHPQLWQRVFPLSFHVTYWNNLGWEDTWSQGEFTERQYAYYRGDFSSQVYTPQLMINGDEIRRWTLLGWSLTPVPELSETEAGVLTAQVEKGLLQAGFSRPLQKDARLRFAWVLPTAKVVVKRGENQGRTLNNPFVVLSVTDIPGTGQEFAGDLPASPDIDDEALAWVLWLEEQGQPVQAVGGRGAP